MKQVPISEIKRAVFNLRKEIADINGESPTEDKKHLTYMWKGLIIQGHKTRPTASIYITNAEEYKPIPDVRYILMLIRDDLVREKQILTRQLINKITRYKDETQ